MADTPGCYPFFLNSYVLGENWEEFGVEGHPIRSLTIKNLETDPTHQIFVSWGSADDLTQEPSDPDGDIWFAVEPGTVDRRSAEFIPIILKSGTRPVPAARFWLRAAGAYTVSIDGILA